MKRLPRAAASHAAMALLLLTTACAPASPQPRALGVPVSGDRGIPYLAPLEPTAKVFGAIPMTFMANLGQVDPRVQFVSHRGRIQSFFTESGVTHVLHGQTAEDRVSNESVRRAWDASRSPLEIGRAGDRELSGHLGQYGDAETRTTRWALRSSFGPGSRSTLAEGGERLPGIVSYFKGRPEEWIVGIPTYGHVVYRDVWPGIDAVYAADGRNVKSAFIVDPGADPTLISLTHEGATGARLDEQGQTILSTPVGDVIHRAPVAWQEDASGQRQPIDVHTSILLEDDSQAVTERYVLGSYDSTRVLIVDPTILYAGYIGGAGVDDAKGIAVDGQGEAYITGSTTSSTTTFPETVGPILTFGGGADAMVVKVSATGTSLVYAGYIGGTGLDIGASIAVDGLGQAYVTGETSSNQSTFPVLVGPHLTYGGSGSDAFVAKVSANGQSLAYAGFIGGHSIDIGHAIAVDSQGRAYVAGQTDSSQNPPSGNPTPFPVVGGPSQIYGGATDAFVGRVAADGASMEYLGYVGGASGDIARAVAVDGQGQAYIGGATSSSPATFPDTTGPSLVYKGAGDGFIAKVAADGSALVYAGYIGGSAGGFSGDGGDEVRGLALDGQGSAYVTGRTSSHHTSFPVMVGPSLVSSQALGSTIPDAFVAKVRPDGTGFVYAGYIGGGLDDFGNAIAVDAQGQASVVGGTRSTASTFPELGDLDPTHNGGEDAFLAKVRADGQGLVHAGYIGGDGNDRAQGVALDSTGRTYVVGFTESTETAFPDANFHDVTYNLERDAFVARISADADCGLAQPAQVSVVLGAQNRLDVTVTRGNANNGRITSLRFRGASSAQIPTSNVLVTIGNLVNQSGDFVFTLNPPATSQSFSIQRASNSGSGTIAFDVVDNCGTWTKFVGGGESAWGGGNGPVAALPTPTSAVPTPGPVTSVSSVGVAPGQACASFPTHAAAQAHLRADPADPLNMDRNRNGIACEGADGAGFVNPPLDHVPVPRR